MKKRACLAVLAVSLALILLPGMAAPAFAASARASGAALRNAQQGESWRHWRWGCYRSTCGWWAPDHHFYPQENNQYFRGSSNSGNYQRFTGSNLGNTGNQGHNRNIDQDNSVNGGNQMINQGRRRGFWRNNQYYWGEGNGRNILIYNGYNEGNSGNQGLNDGINQDNSTNSGNQLVN